MNSKIKILVIDDNRDNRISLKALINVAFPTATVFLAESGKQGLGIAVSENPDVVLLDIVMPDMDGFEVCRHFKSNRNLADIPVVFLTAMNVDSKSRYRALDVGAEAFLPKPIDETELVVQINAMVKIKAANRQVRNEQERLNELVAERTFELEQNQLKMNQLVEELKTEIESHKETEAALHKSEEKWRKLVHTIPDYVGLFDRDGKYLFLNHYAEGFSIKDIEGKSYNDFLAEDYREVYESAFELAKNTGTMQYLEYTAFGDNYSYREYENYFVPLFENNQYVNMLVIARDITEKKKTENALVNSEERLKRAELESKSGNWELHLDTQTIVGSEGALKIYGIQKDQLNYQYIRNFPLPEYRPLIDSALKDLIEKNQPYKIDFKIKTFDTGEIRDIHSVAIYDSEKHTVFGIIQDITERKVTESKLKESEEKHRLMFETAHEGIVIAQDFKLIYFNPKFVEITGYSESELMNMPFIQLIHPDDHELLLRNYQNRIADQNVDQFYEFKMVRKDNEIRWVTLTGAKLIWNGMPATFNFIKDITERKQAELQLRKSEERYRLITENTSDVIWILNLNQRKFAFISPSILQLRGYTIEEAKAQTLEQSMTPESLKLVSERIERALPLFLENKIPEHTSATTQIQQPCKDGRTIWVEVATQFQFNSAGEVEVLGVSRNIELRKKMEKELRESEIELRELNATKDKFFSIIAHDLKNPFNTIIGFSELLKQEAHALDVDEITQYAKLINTSANNTLQLLENLLDWALIQQGQILFNPKLLILSEVTKDAMAVVHENAVQKKITIENIIPANLIVLADENMIKTIIRNLLGNAIKFTRPEGRVKISARTENENMVVCVADTGVGINTENIRKLFDVSSGFTMRGTGNERGTGLGLILCREFVEKHNGRIWVESEEGKGSTITFSIPCKTPEKIAVKDNSKVN